MKKVGIIIYITIIATTISAAIPTRYYVGRIEVSESFWNQMPDSLDYILGEFNYDTLTIKSRELPFTHYIDSISIPGKYTLSMRSPEVIAELAHAYSMLKSNLREKSLSLSAGDEAPQIQLLRYKDNRIFDRLLTREHCYLLSFWATWCGNCLHELSPEFIPSVADKFSDDASFHFIPVCIDATADDLHRFFSSRTGRKWHYLSEITYLDTDLSANEKFGESGVMPLNVVIGKNGNIIYIHSGAIKDKEALSELYDAIKSGL